MKIAAAGIIRKGRDAARKFASELPFVRHLFHVGDHHKPNAQRRQGIGRN